MPEPSIVPSPGEPIPLYTRRYHEAKLSVEREGATKAEARAKADHWTERQVIREEARKAAQRAKSKYRPELTKDELQNLEGAYLREYAAVWNFWRRQGKLF